MAGGPLDAVRRVHAITSLPRHTASMPVSTRPSPPERPVPGTYVVDPARVSTTRIWLAPAPAPNPANHRPSLDQARGCGGEPGTPNASAMIRVPTAPVAGRSQSPLRTGSLEVQDTAML